MAKIIKQPPSKCDAFTQFILSELKVEVVKEHKFHPTRGWLFDYAIPSHRIAIEKDGGIFTQTTYVDKKTNQSKTIQGGRHTIGKGYIADLEKFNTAASLGWLVIRATKSQLMTTKMLEYIKGCMQNR